MKGAWKVTGIIKRLFPVILKPVTLVLLFFIATAWIYHVCFAVRGTNIAIDPDFTPEMRSRELDRVSSFWSFLMNVFTGNFGVSFMSLRPVSEELSARLPTTLLLIALSILFSLLVGVDLSAIMHAWPSKRRPSTFAHSLWGYLFGVTPFLAVSFMFFFCYYASSVLDFQIFPASGISSRPQPADPLAYMADVAWHLVLPVTVLVSVNVVRLFFVIWSSGTPFTSKITLKRLLLPITATDFTFTISAVIFVEWIFTLPGLGRWFLNSLMAADYPVMMAVFVWFVGIAVALGFVSVLFDFVQRFVGLRDDLDKKIVTQLKINESETMVHKRNGNFLSRRKALVVGSAIVVVFLMLAAFAPFITPCDLQGRAAQDFAMPAWVTIFPQYGNLSTTQKTQLYWHVEKGPEFVKSYGKTVTVQYEADGIETVDVQLSANFSYLGIPPNDFYLNFAWKSEEVQDTAYSLKLTLSTPEGKDYDLWVQPPLSMSSGANVFVESTDPFLKQRLGFQMHENLALIIFSEKGEYSTLLQIQFRSESEYAKCGISFENTEFAILGQAHGILGTDSFGADVFAQLVYGARTILIFALPFAFLAAILGLPYGFLAGYFQSWADNIMTLVVDTLLCLPILPTLLVYVFLFGKSWISFLPISLLFLSALATKAFRNAFLVRPSNQKLKGNTTAKQEANVLKDLVVNFCLMSISLVLLLSSIEFLGFGDPRVPSWGKMLQHAFAFGGFPRLAWWWILPPAVCIALFSLGLLMVGLGLEDGKS